ncbi:Ig-like domain-containing protein [Egicoccus sp. AB-alg2]|uniref:Ig-like domain-containing protein n=1 Tax=Egicoccus sp. AB-alg2 TaxID=3242693 RepID=UPI00359DBD55
MSSSYPSSPARRLPVTVALLVALVLGLLPASAAPAQAAPAAPTLTEPTPGASVGSNPLLAWKPVTGAVRYRVQVATNATFTALVYSVETASTAATPPQDLPLGTLYWRVAGIDAKSVVGVFATSSFERAWSAAPTLVSPAQGATLRFPSDPLLFAWDPVVGAKQYRIQIDDAEDFIGAEEYLTDNTSFTLSEPRTVDQDFYWRVQAVSATSKVNSAWSQVRRFRVAWGAMPTLVSPLDDAEVTDVILRWSAVDGAAHYHLQVSPNGDWANNVTINETKLAGTVYSPPTTLDNGTYFWRVRALDARASTPNFGEWSPPRRFTRSWQTRPTLLAPADQDWNVREPTFRWSPVDHASHYELQVGTDVNFSPGTFSACPTNRTTYTPYPRISSEPACTVVGLNPGTRYYWRVRALDAPRPVNGLWSNFSDSDVHSFIYRPGIAALLAPATGSTEHAPVLRWAPVPDIGKYRVTILRANGTSAQTVETFATSFTPTNTLKMSDGPFSWYVETLDAHGKRGLTPPANQWRTFTLTEPTSTGSTPEPRPVEPSGQRMPSLQWRPVAGATEYRVFYGGAGTGVAHLLGKTPYAAFTSPATPLAAGNYFWYVEAWSKDGFLGAGAEGTFSITPFDQVAITAPTKCEPGTACTTIGDTPTLTWEAVPNAGGYWVYVATDRDFTTNYRTYWTTYTTLTPRESFKDNQAGQAYYWFVRACTQGGTSPCGRFDSGVHPKAGAFQKHSSAIETTAPAHDGAAVPDLVTFNWRSFLDTNGDRADAGTPRAATQEARQYRIQVSTAADFKTVLDAQVVDQTTYTPAKMTYPEGPLYWRVQAIDNSGNDLTFSDCDAGTAGQQPCLVRKESPRVAPVAPANGATVRGMPSLSWKPQAYAAQYQVEVYRNSDLQFSPTNLVANPKATKTTAWASTTALPSGGYAWRVRRLDADGRPGPWSAGRTFTLQAAAPTLLSPANGLTVTGGDPVFTWSAVEGVAQYRFEVSTSSSFTSFVDAQTTVMTRWAPTKKYPDGVLHWRVKALDARGNVVGTSSVRTFTKDGTAPKVTQKAPTSAFPLSGPLTVTFSEPVTGVTTTTFSLRAGTATSALAASVKMTSPTTAALTPASPLVPGQSYTASLTNGIRDAAGNRLAATSWTARAKLAIEENEPAIRATWDRDTHSSASGGGYAAARTKNSSLTFTFTGTNVTVLGRRSTAGGYADIYLDGVKQNSAPVSFHATSTQWQRSVWSKSGLPNAKHRLEVRVLGTKPSASSAPWVEVDAFKVGTTLFQETHASVVHRHPRVSRAGASGGGEFAVNHWASGDNGGRPEVMMQFRGTGVTWYGTKGPNAGTATVFVDGVNRGTVDLYASSASTGATVWRSPTLTDGLHTIRIVVDGKKRAAATGTVVHVDRLVVR